MIYFAFGSNLNLRQMAFRCPGARPVIAAMLSCHRLTFCSPGGGYGVATVEPDESSSVFGALYEITKTDLTALDRYEGHPRLYRREVVTVDANDGRSLRAIVYIMNEPACEVQPSPSYLAGIIKGYSDWNIPADALGDIDDELETWRRAADER